MKNGGFTTRYLQIYFTKSVLPKICVTLTTVTKMGPAEATTNWGPPRRPNLGECFQHLFFSST